MLKGSFIPPGDKSISHRIALFSLLADGKCRVHNYSPCDDCRSTLGAVAALGGQAGFDGADLVLSGLGGALSPEAGIDCGNSGTSIRFLIGILAGVPGRFTLDGDDSLRKRPMERVAAPLREMGADITCSDGRPPVAISGQELRGVSHRIKVASAQLKSALLLAGLRAKGVTCVKEPHLSRDHTERMLAGMGAKLSHGESGVCVEGSAITLPDEFQVPGDASSAAFFLCAAAIIPGSRVVAEKCMLNPTRTGFMTVLERMGVRLEIDKQSGEPEPWGAVGAAYTPELTGCTIQAAEIPLLVDEVPILALTATQAQGATVFKDVSELRIKESDRVSAVVTQLGAMGAKISAPGDDLIIEGPTPLSCPPQLDSYGDHRIAMTLRLATLLTGQRGAIKDESCAAVSYPNFAETLAELER